MGEPRRPRIQIDVSEELYERYYGRIPWGNRSAVMAKIIEQFITAVENHGESIAFLILGDKLKLFGGLGEEKENGRSS